MIKNKTIFKSVLSWVSALAIITASPLVHAQDSVTVTVLAVHTAGNIQYTYQVTNRTNARKIESVSIGNRGDQSPTPASSGNAQPELIIYPAGSYWQRMPDQGDSVNVTLRVGGTYTSPPGWTGGILDYEETTKFSVDWNIDESITSNFPVIYPGQTFNFGVTVPFNNDPRSPYSMSDPAYLTGHFTVGFDYSKDTYEGPSYWNYTGVIAPIDTTPPTISVTLSPATLWPPNDKLTSITATITAKDDYDPEPEIKLESITASETLADGDIQDAQLQTDDRSFSLAAKRDGNNMAGRIYTVTYSATDASGNKATASATVTVPHDQGK
jgi:hypothetical protein